ncbi:MAG: hypothetical protein J6U60_01005 [Clostridia bacterium]|nr:hypothetical protein [Clostridia bacterium]
MKKRGILLSLLLAVMLLPAVGTVTVSAGKSNKQVVTSGSFEEYLDMGVWYASGDVKTENNELVFNSKNEEFIIAKQSANDFSAYDVEELIKVDLSMKILELSSTAPFSIRFGLPSFSLIRGIANSGEITFVKKDNGIIVSVNSYNDQEEKTELYSGVSPYVVFDETFQLQVSVKADGKVNVVFGNGAESATFYDNTSLEGYFDGIGCFGFSKPASADNVNVIFEEITATAYTYNNPSNPVSVKETFDNDEFNKEAWYTICTPTAGRYAGGTMSLKNNELFINNANEALISTRHEFSNFELTFDITDMHREAFYDENGKLNPVSGWLGISFGAAQFDSSFYASVRESTFFQFETSAKTDTEPVTSGRYLLWENAVPLKYEDIPDGYNFWKKEDVVGADGKERTINVKFTMLDGVFSCWTKYADQTFSVTPQFTYDIGYTPLGFVRILAYGGFTGAYASIDNIEIINKDVNAEDCKVEIDYGSNSVTYEKFEYVDTWDDKDLLKEGTVAGESGCASSLVGGISTAGILASAALVIVKRRKEGKK